MNAAAMSTRGVLCVDDNPMVREALRLKFSTSSTLEWMGELPDATGLVEWVRDSCPLILLLDLDMPGPEPLDVLAELMDVCPDTRTIVFTGHVRRDLIDRAFDAGAWGYVSKNDGDDHLFAAIEKVLRDQFAFSPEVRATLDA